MFTFDSVSFLESDSEQAMSESGMNYLFDSVPLKETVEPVRIMDIDEML